uniref:Hydroxymethylglutaryl-CoA reductase, degradative (MvaA) n=1 Tax=uncultured marine thaumarchaeote AD1000_40_H03 TaxID=1455914 RepID=A0A075FR85_9ARCH|nr:hydroxymethylglutaryl-CoA reductase, degradative (mvaA) [uncultured marine thaumarchaeote AD1000_40_H03]
MKSLKERLSVVGNFANLTEQELEILENATGGIDYSHADKMIENAIGTFSLPIGIATNFQINEKDYLIPMVIEEPSVVAASSKAAKIARIHGGFKATAEGNYSIGQIQIVDVDVQETIPKIISISSEIIELANSKSETLSKLGKGVKEITCKEVKLTLIQC